MRHWFNDMEIRENRNHRNSLVWNFNVPAWQVISWTCRLLPATFVWFDFNFCTHLLKEAPSLSFCITCVNPSPWFSGFADEVFLRSCKIYVTTCTSSYKNKWEKGYNRKAVMISAVNFFFKPQKSDCEAQSIFWQYNNGEWNASYLKAF